MGAPLASACARAVASIAGLLSIPTIDPVGPASSAAKKLTGPGPQPTSSTLIPSATPASRSTCRVLGWRSSPNCCSRAISVSEVPKT